MPQKSALKRLGLALVSALALFAAGCGPTPDDPLSGGCQPSFPYNEGWLGGDGGKAVPLGGGKSFWIFGDSFVGKEGAADRNGSVFIHNSVALSQCDPATQAFTVRYSWAGKASGQVSGAYFKPASLAYWFWPLDGFMFNGKLYVALQKVKATGTGAFGFQVIGSALARIDDPSGPVDGWTYTLVGLYDGTDAAPGTTIVTDGGYAYFFSMNNAVGGGVAPLIVTRIALDEAKLGAPSSSLEYLSGDGTWKPGLVVSDAKPVIADAVEGMSVRFHRGSGEWVAVQQEPSAFSSKVVVRTAPSMLGPWSGGTVVYRFPEMTSGEPGYQSGSWCYAVGGHSELELADDLVFTYACNTLNQGEIWTNMSLYVPKAVRVRWPQ